MFSSVRIFNEFSSDHAQIVKFEMWFIQSYIPCFHVFFKRLPIGKYPFSKFTILNITF